MAEHTGEGEILLTKPKKKRSRLNIDKARAYLKEYTTNGFNKTRALNAVNPKAKYESNHTNCSAYHNRIRANEYIEKKFKLSDITPEYIIENINKELEKAVKSGDRLKALQLLGDFRKLWSDKSINLTQNITTKEDISLIERLYGRVVNTN